MAIYVADEYLAFRDNNHFTKNPDVVRLPSGKLLCTFNLTNQHWPTEYAHITLIESVDGGRTWGNPRTISESHPAKGEEPWVTPRLTLLKNGRLILLCDQNDFRHCHESQIPGIYAWWSDDAGDTWSGPYPTGIPGIEPDRVRELPDGTLLVGSHYMFKKTHKLGQVSMRSYDGGQNWIGLSVVASDKVHNYCEGALVPLCSGRIACIMRDNNHNNYPCYISFSDDGGESWSRPVEAPFSGDRPFAEQLPDGRVLVTYRNQAGRPGLMGWVGDIEREWGYKVSVTGVGPSHRVSGVDAGNETRQKPIPADGGASFNSGALQLTASKCVARYCLLPPESDWSDIDLCIRLRVKGEDGCPCAIVQIARIGLQLHIYPDALSLNPGNPELHRPVDMRMWRELHISHIDGKTEISVDNKVILRRLVYQQGLWDRSFIGLVDENASILELSSVSYHIENPSEPVHNWRWSADSGDYPNQYEIDRWSMLHENTKLRPDHGYSTWLPIEGNKFLVLDYSNKMAPAGKAYINCYVVDVEGSKNQMD